MITETIDGDVRKAAAIHRELLPLTTALFLVSNPIPIKFALNYLGIEVGQPRLPLTPPDEKTAAAIEAVLKNYRFDIAFS